MNSLYSKPGTVSCAIDCFLEVSRYIFQPAFLNLSVRTDFIHLLHNAMSEYNNVSKENSNYLPQVREPVWYYLTHHCSTLLPRDSNASFSQIFEEQTFGKLNPDEMNLFMTQRSFESHCQTCQKTVSCNMKLFLLYVSIASLKQTGFDISCWPLSVSHIFKKQKKMVCKHCSESNVSDPICTSAVNSKFVLIEFSNEIINCVTIHEETEFNGSPYTLQGLVRCFQRHFTCAIKIENKWVYFDDMCSTVQEFSSLYQLKQHYPVGWFFAIFQLSIIDPSISSCDLQNETILSPTYTFKRKRNHDDISWSSKKQSKVDQLGNDRKAHEQNPGTENVLKKKSPKAVQSNNDMKMHDKKSCTENMKKFHKAMQLCIYQCTVCHEAWPLKTKAKEVSSYVCSRCSRDKNNPKKFSAENSMVPSPVPKQL